MRSGIFYYCGDEKTREQVTELFARERLELKPYEYYKIDEIDHYFIKNYNRAGVRGQGDRDEDPQRVYAAMRTKSLENTDSSMITGLSACDDKDTLQNVLFAYYHLGFVRNKIRTATKKRWPRYRAKSRRSFSSAEMTSAKPRSA